MRAVAGVAALLTACSGSSSTQSTPPPPTAPVVEMTTSSSSSTTAPAPTTTATARPSTTAPAPMSPEATAKAFFAAWAGGDRGAATRVAQAPAVDALFARRWQAADGWAFSECSGAAGSVICTWRRPAGQELLMRVQSTTGGAPVTVAEARFQP